MAEAGIDVLMKVVGPKGTYAAESGTQFQSLPVADPLCNDFTPGQFCELKEFSFSAGVGGSTSKHTEKKREAEKAAKAAEDLKSGKADEDKSELRRMLDLRNSQDKKRKKHLKEEDVDMEEVEFTRVLDCMSPQLFSALVGCDTLTSISVVKRKASGSSNSGNVYLRLDFSGVLLTKVEWKDDQHVMTESTTFIYRKVTMRYRPQKADGTLGVAIQAEWTMRAAGMGT